MLIEKIPAAPGKPLYRPELDALRAFAFLGVFMSHWLPHDLRYYLSHGIPRVAALAVWAFSFTAQAGVMVFFCLSSYLITGLLLRELRARGNVDVGAFYMRRLLRIWPLYLAFTALALAIAWVDPDQLFGWKHGLAFALFSGNWIWALNLPVNTVALPLWSISVEEQFYLIWPWVVRRAGLGGLRRAALALLGLAFVSRCLVVAGVLRTDLWHSTFTQFEPIALGALLALSGTEPRTAGARAAGIAGGLSALFAAQFLIAPDEIGWRSLLYYPLVSGSCAAILWGFIGMKLDPASRVARALISAGKISYGLYVFHFLAFYLVLKGYALIPYRINFAVGFLGRGAAAMLLTWVAASLSYRWLEIPFLSLKARFTPEARSRAAVPVSPGPLAREAGRA